MISYQSLLLYLMIRIQYCAWSCVAIRCISHIRKSMHMYTLIRDYKHLQTKVTEKSEKVTVDSRPGILIMLPLAY